MKAHKARKNLTARKARKKQKHGGTQVRKAHEQLKHLGTSGK